MYLEDLLCKKHDQQLGWGRWPEPALAAGGSAGPGSPMGGAQMNQDNRDVSSLAEQIGPDH